MVTFQMWWVWMALAAFFIAGEVFRKGSIFLWLGFGAAVSGILALLDIPVTGQIAVFMNISGILIVLERRFSERYTFKKPSQSVRDSSKSQVNGIRPSPNDDDPYQNTFRKVGPGWDIRYSGKSYTIKHSIGLFHIRNLIIKQGEWISSSQLKQLCSGDGSESVGLYHEMSIDQLDAENLRINNNNSPEDIIQTLPLEKIKRLREALRERIELDDFNSPEDRIDQHNTLEFIEKYLTSVTDKKGRPRKIQDQTETDRKAVSAAINRCRNSLKAHNELYTHLQSFIQAKGNSFRYLPDRPMDWKTD